MKKYILILIAIFLISCNNDEGGSNGLPTLIGVWMIDNQSSQEFIVDLDFIPTDDIDHRALVEACSLAYLTPWRHRAWDGQEDFIEWHSAAYTPTYAYENELIITLEFPNGISHTFSGEFIERDMRDENSWHAEYKMWNNKKYVWCAEHTYTFTDEDYERIMALYEE